MKRRGFGGVYLRGSIWWLRYWHRGQEYRESSGSESEAKAAALLKARIQAMGRPGRFIGPAQERVTFADLAEMIRTDYGINRFRSAEQLTCRIAHLSSFFAHTRAIDITTDLIQRYIADRQQAGASNGTINRELGTLKRPFHLAVRAERLAHAPHIPMLAEPTPCAAYADPAITRSDECNAARRSPAAQSYRFTKYARCPAPVAFSTPTCYTYPRFSTSSASAAGALCAKLRTLQPIPYLHHLRCYSHHHLRPRHPPLIATPLLSLRSSRTLPLSRASRPTPNANVTGAYSQQHSSTLCFTMSSPISRPTPLLRPYLSNTLTPPSLR